MSKRGGKPGRAMALADLLFTQGFGVRDACAGLVRLGQVRVGGEVLTDPATSVQPEGLAFEVFEGGVWQPWLYQAQAVVLLHKPLGYECSQKPSAWPSVLQLLPAPLRRRGVQPVGRLDQDTTGLLLLTDDGALIHRWTHPKRHVDKVYLAQTARPLDEAQCQRLVAGVVLNDDPVPVKAAAAEMAGPQTLRLTLDQGKYHQVRRMIAAVGNHCEALHRERFGRLALTPDLPAGTWRWASPDEV